MSKTTYKIENALDPSEFLEVLIKSTLAERRPVDDLERIKKMCASANLIVSAKEDEKLVGVARSVTDFAYCTYLSDLAVDVKYQKMGIGKRLIEETKKAAPQAKIILLSAPAAIDYYPKIGMRRHEHCFTLDDISELK
ncbi:MAG: GNAT family N-acetyltransferase [Ignavibacteriaceae bacterium]